MTIFLTALFTTLAWINVINAVFCYKHFVKGTYKSLLKGYKVGTKIVLIIAQVVGCVGIGLGALAYWIHNVINDMQERKTEPVESQALTATTVVEVVETKPIKKKKNNSPATEPQRSPESWV